MNKVCNKSLQLDSIRLDGDTQPRAEIDEDLVAEYAEAIKDDAEFPPAVVFHDGTDYWLADGFHRYHAARQAGLTSLASGVRTGTRRDAILYSVGANATHGKRRTNADKRKAVLTLLRDEEWAGWSDREIARRAAVDHSWVSKLRRENLPVDKPQAERKWTTRHGTTATMDTTNIGKTKQEAAPTHLNPLQSQTEEWYTPPEYIEAARSVLGGIDVDPATNPTAQEIVQADAYYTKDADGLSVPWSGRLWLNPPYGPLASRFVTKAVEEFDAGSVTSAILLLNSNSNETEWFQPLWDHTLCFSRGRVNFYYQDEEGDERRASGSTHGSVFVYLGPDWEKFAKTFSEFGNVVRRVDV